MHQPDKDFTAAKNHYDHWVTGDQDRIIKRRREMHYLAGGGGKGRGNPGPRTSITKYTPTSASRLRRYVDNYYCDFYGMVTLTYGQQWPTDGRQVKKHLNAFVERLRRLGWLEEDSLVWWLEFQARGAPHIHMVVTGWLSRHWVASAWSEITGTPVESGTRVERLRDPDAAGSYAGKYCAKSEQKEVPPGYENVGRFWGRRGKSGPAGNVPKVSAASTVGARAYVRAAAGAHIRARARAIEQGRGVRDGYKTPVVVPWLALPSVRAYEHEGGWSFYGKEQEIDELWHYLRGAQNGVDQHESA